MRIELVGGPNCGETMSVGPDLMPEVCLFAWDGRAVRYRRRDRAYSTVGLAGALIGQGGYRMYDYAGPGAVSIGK